MKTTLEKIAGFDVLHIEGIHTFDGALELPAVMQGCDGIRDWVLPDRATLAALQIVAEGVCGDLPHWSSSPYVGSSNYAWYVDFYNGNVDDNDRNNNNQVRLVRASQCLAICKAAAEKSLKEAGIEVPVQPAPVQEPVGWLTKEEIKFLSQEDWATASVSNRQDSLWKFPVFLEPQDAVTHARLDAEYATGYQHALDRVYGCLRDTANAIDPVVSENYKKFSAVIPEIVEMLQQNITCQKAHPAAPLACRTRRRI